jgi:hypothetical protein
MPKPYTAALFSENYRIQEARAAAALPAAGAFDATPTELYCPETDFVTLYITYTRGAVNGAVTFKLEVSPRTADDAVLEDWYQAAILAGGAVAANADTTSSTQREEVEYGATAAAAEMFVYGPVELRSTVERIRVPCAESGVVGTPGTAQITAIFS